jgi:tRNA threonylcarbamoyladenosine biosynthesis protein TsaB
VNDAPLILGFDTSGAHCAAALMRGDTLLAAVGEDMARGQAERLMGVLEDVLTAQSVTWTDLNALAVGVGPGNFTGIRIGVSAARGLALGLGIPAYGVTGFEARVRIAPAGTTVTVPAPRDTVYICDDASVRQVPAYDISNPAPDPSPAELAHTIAAHGVELWPSPATAPAPFYVRAPDAAPARDIAPTILP